MLIMKKIRLIGSLFIILWAASCNSSVTKIFTSNKTPHEKYKDKLEDIGLEKTADGKQWLAASTAALQTPQLINVPHRLAGNFPTDKPRALGLIFKAKAGEQLQFSLQKKGVRAFVLYAELYEQKDNGETKLLKAVDTAARRQNHRSGGGGPVYALRRQHHFSAALGKRDEHSRLDHFILR